MAAEQVCLRVSVEVASVHSHLELRKLGAAAEAELLHLLPAPADLVSELLHRRVVADTCRSFAVFSAL